MIYPPLYNQIGDLFQHGFRIDRITASYLAITHLYALVATPLAYYLAPPGFWQAMLGWSLIHALVGSLSTTVYAHRLITHSAAREIHWLVHLLFGFIGHVLAMQGSVLRWATMHVVHHSVDSSGKHQLDPYSATWFPKAWQNFLWSHVLTFCFHHPANRESEAAYNAKARAMPILRWQERLYVPLLVGLNYVLPFALGAWLGGLMGGFCLLTASVGGFILAQHNTWTVNSVTHMWGFKKGLISSAKNNYLWLGPMGEGNHHADHHDYGKDYRNGFGWQGWLLDPTRYVILLLRGLGLLKGLRRASKRKEAEIIAQRKLRDAAHSHPLWQDWEAQLITLKQEWLEAVHRWEAFKAQKLQLKTRPLPRLELERRLVALRAEMTAARAHMQEARARFFLTIREYQAAALASV